MTWPPHERPARTAGPNWRSCTSRRRTTSSDRGVLCPSQTGDVVFLRGQGVRGGGDVVAVGLQALDDATPAGALGPCAVDENDVRSGVHLMSPFVVASSPIVRPKAAAGVSAAL